MSKKAADLICRGLLMIVAAIREEAQLPEYRNITIKIDGDFVGIADYKEPTLTTEALPQNP